MLGLGVAPASIMRARSVCFVVSMALLELGGCGGAVGAEPSTDAGADAPGDAKGRADGAVEVDAPDRSIADADSRPDAETDASDTASANGTCDLTGDWTGTVSVHFTRTSTGGLTGTVDRGFGPAAIEYVIEHGADVSFCTGNCSSPDYTIHSYVGRLDSACTQIVGTAQDFEGPDQTLSIHRP
jgi:hypothetical protein